MAVRRGHRTAGRRKAARRAAGRGYGPAPPYALVLVVMGCGLGAALVGHFRMGAGLVAAAVLLAALARAVLPERRIGMLAIRAKWIDVTMMAAMAVATLVLAWFTRM